MLRLDGIDNRRWSGPPRRSIRCSIV